MIFGGQRGRLLLLCGVATFGAGACASKEKRAVKAFCESYDDCQPENFAEQYDDVDECISETMDALDEAEEENGQECADSFGVAIECAADANAESCDYTTVLSECDDKIFEALELCPSIDIGSLDLGGL
jgi:hypothetical protein